MHIAAASLTVRKPSNPARQTAVHVAIAWRNETSGSLAFVEALPPAVRLTPADQFWKAWPAGTTFYRGWVRDPLIRRAYGRRAADIALAQLDVPYASAFGPPPREFYCSSLVEWSYAQAASTPSFFVDAPFRLIFTPRAFWERYYAAQNITLPQNQTGSNPTLLLHSRHAQFADLGAVDGTDRPEPPPLEPPPELAAQPSPGTARRRGTTFDI